MNFKEFCDCGQPIYIEKGCPKHGYETPFGTKERKQNIGKYSGLSRSEHAYGDYK